MNAHCDNSLVHALRRIAGPAPVNETRRDQIEAVANAIGCPEHTMPAGCDRKSRDPRNECWCATAVKAVLAIEKLAQAVPAPLTPPNPEFWQGSQE